MVVNIECLDSKDNNFSLKIVSNDTLDFTMEISVNFIELQTLTHLDLIEQVFLRKKTLFFVLDCHFLLILVGV